MSVAVFWIDLAGILGLLAFILALLALAFAVRGRTWSGRADSILLSLAILVGTTRYYLPPRHSIIADAAAPALSLVLTGIVLWRLVRGHGR